MQHRDLRVADAIRDIVADIVLTKLSDPAIGFVTITRCSLSRDLRNATVYFSVMGDESQRQRSRTRLEHARRFIRRLLGQRLKMKFLPELHFELDEILIEEQRIGEILDQLNPEEEERKSPDNNANEDNTPSDEK
ncbi:30S ribosome-binding factor RbfA [candidate division WOR-3 bacterium]|nr:30S ribosome-binding factor RbfA [candidate division WOR-3 bacterium]